MVVGRFRRTVSFPNPIQTRPSKPPTTKPYHVRSASLPCGTRRTHPLISQLQSEINDLRLWETRRSSTTTTTWSWLEEGLNRLKTIHETLDDILQLPQTHDSLTTTTTTNGFISKLLEDYLQFVDIYGIFRSTMLALKQDISSAQVALRTTKVSDDDSSNKMSIYMKAQRKGAKDMSRLISTIRSIDRPPSGCDPHPGSGSDENNNYEELSLVHDLTITVSAAVFDGLLMLLSSGRRSASWAAGFPQMMTRVESMGRLTRMKSNKWEEGDNSENVNNIRLGKLKSMQEMEDRIGLMENGSEKVFRSLITTRVSLLNILTHTS